MFLPSEESYDHVCHVLVGYTVLVAQTGSYTHVSAISYHYRIRRVTDIDI
jgi:hypothetical protein